MFEAGDIRERRGHAVVDADRHKIGALESFHGYPVTGQPSFATATRGLPTHHAGRARP
ncbi:MULTISPECIES: hypothetical protein [Kitasatospora]|uniref:PRC-barrel domain containing protein n=1 Tax=Kitasatospora arboriphila TaxID=258052 RepID=A0ABP4E9V0_9ACTN